MTEWVVRVVLKYIPPKLYQEKGGLALVGNFVESIVSERSKNRKHDAELINKSMINKRGEGD